MLHKKIILFLFLLVLLLLAACQSQIDLSQPPEIRFGEEVCTECGMIISEPRYAAAYYTTQGDARRFDDIGGMFTYQAEHQEDVAQSWVHDFDTEELVKADQAFYVISDQLHTPMGFGVIAFSEQDRAQRLASKSNTLVMSFDESLMSYMEFSADHEHSEP